MKQRLILAVGMYENKCTTLYMYIKQNAQKIQKIEYTIYITSFNWNNYTGISHEGSKSSESQYNIRQKHTSIRVKLIFFNETLYFFIHNIVEYHKLDPKALDQRRSIAGAIASNNDIEHR